MQCNSNLHHTDEVMKQLVTSLVLSRLDYCNSVLFGLPASTLAPLLRVQNVAARLVLRLDHRAHIKPALRLHWLPVKAHIEFGIATVKDAILKTTRPDEDIPHQRRKIQHRRIWTPPAPFLYNQRSCCHEDSDPVWEARLLCLRSKYLKPDSSSHQEPSFCSGFSQSSKDICFRKSSRHCNALSVSLL